MKRRIYELTQKVEELEGMLLIGFDEHNKEI